MVLKNEDKILIKNFYLFKNYSAKKLIREFPENYFLKKPRESESTGRKPGSGMQHTFIHDAIDEAKGVCSGQKRAL